MKAKDCMSEKVICCNTDSTVCDCAKIMSENHIGCVPVCDNSNQIVGLVTDRDIILRSISCDKDVKTTPVTDIMTTNICSCTPESDMQDIELQMSQNQVRRLPVIENNKVVGIITLGDLASNPNVSDRCVSGTVENICKCDKKNAE